MSITETINDKRVELRVEWGGDLKLNAQLHPFFTINAYSLKQKPEVVIKLDSNLMQNGWKENPKLTQYVNNNSSFSGTIWVFHESLLLKPIESVDVASYAFELTVTFKECEDGILRTYQFQGLVNLELQRNQKRELVITASNNAMISTDFDVSQFDNVRIEADDAVISSSDDSDLFDSKKKNELKKELPISYIVLEQVKMESTATDTPVCRQLLIKAETPKGERFFYLYALPKVVIGRDYPKAQMVYRFYRESVVKDSPQEYLSLLISREHMEMNFTEEGIKFQAHGTWGTEIFRDAKDKKSRLREDILPWNELEELKEPEIRLSRFASLPINVYKNQVPSLVEKNLLDTGKLRAKETCLDPLWYLGEERNICALKLSRKKEFLWKNGNEETVISEPNFEVNRKRWENEDAWKYDPYAEDVEYFFVFQAVSLGSHVTTDAVYLNTDQLCTQHLTFCHCSDHFLLANNDSRAIFYTLPGHEKEYLYKNELLPLTPGMTFEVGTLRFSVWKDHREYLEYARSLN